jgi:RNA polymerase sigma-70 factor (ECF subfamily)
MTAASLVPLFPAFTMPEPDRTPTQPNQKVDESTSKGTDQESVDLMMRVREGDMKAFERLVEIHQRAVIGTVARMLGNLDDAHDISQQVFVRVWKSAHRYEPTAKFTTWLFTITRNLVFNETRRRSRRHEVSIERDLEDDGPERQFVEENAPTPDQVTQNKELEAALDQAIAALPEKQRLAVVLRRYEERPYEDLCEILGMSLPAVKSLLFRARTELRKSLASYLEEE